MRACKIVCRLEIPPLKASFVALGLVLPCSSEKIRASFPIWPHFVSFMVVRLSACV